MQIHNLVFTFKYSRTAGSLFFSNSILRLFYFWQHERKKFQRNKKNTIISKKEQSAVSLNLFLFLFLILVFCETLDIVFVTISNECFKERMLSALSRPTQLKCKRADRRRRTLAICVALSI